MTLTDGGSRGAAEPIADGAVAGSVLVADFAGRLALYVVPWVALGFAVRPPAAVGRREVQGTTPHWVIMVLGDFGKTKITPLASIMNPAPAPSAVYHGCLVAASNQWCQIAAWRNRPWAGSSGNPGRVGSVRNRCWSGSSRNPYLVGSSISRC